MGEQRYFTLEQANALVPALESAFQRILALRVQLRAAGTALQKMGEPTDAEGLARDGGPPEARAARGKARALLETLGEELHDLGELGVQVKDIDTGLCDFVALREGREVLLCWKLGEKQVGFWHEVDAGFAGRRPVDAAFERVLH